MSMQDPIADMLTRIRNAQMASLKETSVPASKVKKAIADILKKEGYIEDFFIEGQPPKENLKIVLRYYNNRPVIEGIKRVSKPSCKVYCACAEIPKLRNGLGTVILSTSEGIISGKNAKKRNIGGEILCYVW